MAVRNFPVTRGETVFHSGAWFAVASQLNCVEGMGVYGIRVSIGWKSGPWCDNAAADSLSTPLQEKVW